MTQKVQNGVISNPPKIFTYTLAAGQTQEIDYAYDFMRLLKDTAGSVQIRFGGNPQQTDFYPGLGWKSNDVIGKIFLKNAAASVSTVSVILAIGEIYDNRVYNSDTLYIIDSPFNAVADIPDVTLVANAITAITAATGAAQQEYTFTHKNGSDTIYLGGADVDSDNGTPVAPGDSVTLSFDGVLYAVSAGTPTIGGTRLYRS
jgi:hypothetical protein